MTGLLKLLDTAVQYSLILVVCFVTIGGATRQCLGHDTLHAVTSERHGLKV